MRDHAWTRNRMLALVIVGALAGVMIYALWRLSQSLQREQALGVGSPFPVITVEPLTGDKETMRLPAGKKTLIVFFRWNCPHCVSELVRLDRACRQIPPAKLDCVALAFDSERETRAWWLQSGLQMEGAFVRDPEFIRRSLDWLTAVPLVFLVDERGIITYKRAGERSEEYDGKLLRDFAHR
ncbi:MAG TPA: redoxin domain-containing protein [Blastocatellia bacterium]|nr:redoxin domain-containing protein [Blastocatellia bacterium]